MLAMNTFFFLILMNISIYEIDFAVIAATIFIDWNAHMVHIVN